MRKPTSKTIIVLSLTSLVLIAGLAYWSPPVQERLSWRMDFAQTYVRGILKPARALPTSLPQPRISTTRQPETTPSSEPTATFTPGPTPTPTPSPTPLPQSVSLPAPEWEKQDINNCGPASLAMYLRFYGWKGDQFDIARLLKPQREDRNVNVEELAYYARNYAGWLNIQYRVGGDLELLKSFLAEGIPVMVEEGFTFEETYWPNDDHWAAHYFLVTGYDEVTQIFTGQDSFYGADRQVPYKQLDEYWQSFNRVYILIYPPDREDTVKALLGPNWDPNVNRQHALEVAQLETQSDPENAFAWFNLGTNLVYFERYLEATTAYDTARNLGLPQRMLRYQFGPFMAYFHTGKLTDLMALTEYALERTPNSEEALLWRGWGYYRQGKNVAAIADFRMALEQNPNYEDAKYALNFVTQK